MNKKPIPIPETAIQNLLENIKLYRDEAVNIHKRKGEHTGYEHLGKVKNITDLNGALIYYTEHNGKYYLCPAAIGREVFYNRLKDVIKDYAPCDNIENLCPTCALFGMVRGKHAVASRVRFTDAIVTEKKENLSDYYDETVILPELAAPKLSATEFYLKKPDEADLWNYDYAGRWNRKKDRKEKLKVAYPFYTFDNYNPKIRGRKFYWHQKIDKVLDIQGAVRVADVTAPKEDYKRRVAVRPVKKGITFLFKVYFNEITPDELKKLIWVLELGGSKDHAHKIGMGKPIGLGSVRIQIEKVKVRKIILKTDTLEYKFENFNERLKVTEENYQDIFGCSKQVFEEFMTITNFKNSPQNISYPKNENEQESYAWFVANRQIKGTGTCPVIDQVLPNKLSNMESLKLKKYFLKLSRP